MSEHEIAATPGASGAGPQEPIERRCLPVDYVDEWIPSLRPSPSDWIIRDGNRWHLVACPDYTDDEDIDRPGAALVEGQIVKFEWCKHYPDRVVTVQISEDGEMSHDNIGFIPSEINMFWINGDFDTQADTLDSCLEAYRDMEPLEDCQTLKMSMAEWSGESFRFVVERDVAHFAALARATTEPQP